MPQQRHVFISYSHDSKAHAAFVLDLANRMRADGMDCWLDQYENGAPAQGWQRWMERRIEQADALLIVCTANYLQRYRRQAEQGGYGVNLEALVISQTLYDRYYRNDKFIPVIPDGGSIDHVPLPLKGFNTYRLPADYTALCRVLSEQPATPPPALGGPRELPPGLQAARAGVAKPPVAKPESSPAATARPAAPTNDTIKAAWIGVAALLLAAIVGGLLALFGGSDVQTQGDCSGVFGGEISGNVNIDCSRPAAGTGAGAQ